MAKKEAERYKFLMTFKFLHTVSFGYFCYILIALSGRWSKERGEHISQHFLLWCLQGNFSSWGLASAQKYEKTGPGPICTGPLYSLQAEIKLSDFIYTSYFQEVNNNSHQQIKSVPDVKTPWRTTSVYAVNFLCSNKISGKYPKYLTKCLDLFFFLIKESVVLTGILTLKLIRDFECPFYSWKAPLTSNFPLFSQRPLRKQLYWFSSH